MENFRKNYAFDDFGTPLQSYSSRKSSAAMKVFPFHISDVTIESPNKSRLSERGFSTVASMNENYI